MADGMVPVCVSPEPFGRGSIDLALPDGATVRELLREAIRAGLPVDALPRAEIYINGDRQDRATVLDHQLVEGETINVVAEPLGGGGGGGSKDVGQILLSIAVIAVAGWVGGGAGGMIASKLLARMLAVGVTMIGQAAVASMNKPKGSTKANDRYALQNAQNQYRPLAPQPVALGEVVVAPDLAVKTFTDTVGDDVWLYGILALHRGPCEIEDLKVGDTLVSSLGAGEWRMNTHLTPGPRTFTIYPNDVDQIDFSSLELEGDASSATPVVRAASGDGSRFDLEFYFPKGLYFQKEDGRILSVTASVSIRYRPIDEHGEATGSWATATGFSRSASSKDAFRARHTINLPEGRYEFECTRNKHADNNEKRHHTIWWTSLKSIAYRTPITDEVLSVIEFAVKATAINQGSLAPITCRIKPLIPILEGGEWETEAVSSNPAAVARWLLTGPCAALPLSGAQADQRLRTWYALCEEYDWTCHHYLTEETSQDEALALLEKSGRASVFYDGTQLAAACWVEKPAPKQMFTGANLSDHSFEIVYPDPVHALRVQFDNIDKGGDPDELIVYADGYGATGAGGLTAATLFEALPLEGQMSIERAYRDGRWALGLRIHQKRFDTWTCDVEHLACEYGDRVRLATKRASGPQLRVRHRRYDGSLVAGIRLSQPVEMIEGVTYCVDIRTAAGVYLGVEVETTPGLTRELVFATPRAVAVSPKAGDLIDFGEPEMVTEDVEIVGIAPAEGLKAALTGVRYVAPLLMAGETGPIPPLASHLSGDRRADPPAPTLLGVRYDPNGVRVDFDMGVWRGAPLSGFSVRWRAKPQSGEVAPWEALPALDATARMVRTPPLSEAPVEIDDEDATRVEVEITATTVDGRRSAPLRVTVAKPVPPVPSATDWVVLPKSAAASGQQLPYLIVSGKIDHPDVANVRISFSTDEAGPWTEAYYGPPQTTAYQVGPLVSEVDYYVRITFLSAQGIPSADFIHDAVTAPSLTAGDIITTAPVIVQLQDQLDTTFGDLTLLEEALDDVEAEVVAARGAAATVHARIAAAETATANEVSARASAISRIEARTADSVNMLKNSTFQNNTSNWTLGSWSRQTTEADGPYLFSNASGEQYAVSDLIPTEPGKISYSFNAAGGSIATYIAAIVNGVSTTLGFRVGNAAGFAVRERVENITLPTGTTGIRFVAVKSANNTTTAAIKRIMVNRGEIATDWSDGATIQQLAASVQQHSIAIADVASQQSLAMWEVKTAATGGKPAIIKLVSSSVGSGVMIDGQYLYFGPNTTLDPANNTLQTLAGSYRRVLALGAPFGANADLLEWWGPSSVSLGEMSTLNGYNGRMTSSPYVFDTVNGQKFAVQSSGNVGANRTGAGTVTTATVTFSVVGAVGPVRFDVYNIGGDSTITPVSSGSTDSSAPFSHSTAFTGTVALGQTKIARFLCSVRDANGNSGTAVVTAAISESS